MKSTKKSLLASGLALLASVALLAGTTFAWFTDSVTNSGNKIQAGNLKVDLLQLSDTLNDGQKTALGDDLPADGVYVSIADVKAPIFDYDLWEPGYTDFVALEVSNTGSLALKWKLELTANGAAGILGDVIDVYAKVSDSAITKPETFAAIPVDGEYRLVGTLNELIADPDGAAYGVLYAAADADKPGASAMYAGIALHMRETAGNDYQDESIGATFDLVLNATQYTYEKDGFDNPDYDAEATYPAGPWDGQTADTSWYDPDGTSATYTLGTPDQVAGLAQLVNSGEDFSGKTIVLGENVDLNGKNWTPIGDGSRLSSVATGDSFDGTFDGNGKIISGLTIQNATANDAVGLFGVVDGGTVKNLKLEDVAIDVPACEQAGGAVGMLVNGGTVDAVTVSGSVSSLNGAGGIAGRILKNGSVTNCVNYASVGGSGYNKGGIVGAAYYNPADSGMTIAGCVNNGPVSGTTGVGGIVGLSVAQVENCTNTAPITGKGTSVGGIVGEQQNAGSVTGCINSADVRNMANDFGTGGIVGWVRYSGKEGAYPSKSMITVSGNRNSGNVIGGSSAGGIVGHVYNAALVEKNVNTAASISAGTFAAGIVGSMQEATGNAFEDQLNIRVVDNVSTTSIDAILGSCKHLYAYNNKPNDPQNQFVEENNRATE